MSFLFDVFKLAQNGVPVLIQGAQSLDAAVTCVIALRKGFPGEYLIVSQATGRRIVFTSQGEIRRTDVG
jgi:hypothetical protein